METERTNEKWRSVQESEGENLRKCIKKRGDKVSIEDSRAMVKRKKFQKFPLTVNSNAAVRTNKYFCLRLTDYRYRYTLYNFFLETPWIENPFSTHYMLSCLFAYS